MPKGPVFNSHAREGVEAVLIGLLEKHGISHDKRYATFGTNLLG